MDAASPGAPRKRGRPTPEEREQRRDQILDAAVALFVARGLGQVTIDEIAASSRVTKRTIYTYFGDRAEVFTAVIERFRTTALSEPDAAGSSLLDAAARMVFVLHSDDAVGMHRLMIGESAQFPDLAARFYASGPEGYIGMLQQHLAGDDTAERAEALFGLLLGEPHRRRLLGLVPAPDRAAARAQAERALRLLGHQGGADN
ncbi:TetR/AcrR family transcriptional regulator [Microbacterium sp.]|uniref:TetR/AcrR family transcriptional regulator n=1 Tax=Microbacterium sp. TaxID=51671 RepID=UPI002FE3B1DD